MKQAEFERRYQDQWRQFSSLLDRLERRQTVARESLETYSNHYRRVCQLLGIAKQRSYSEQLVAELNQLVMRGYQQLYRRNNHYGHLILQFVVKDFPALVRREQRFFWLATALLCLPMLLFSWLIYHNDMLAYSVFQPGQLDQFARMYDPEGARVGRVRESDSDMAMFGYYIMNNVGIGFRTFATGLIFGLGSAFFLVYNGVVFGTVAGYLTQLGFASTFYPFVSGHGSFELTAIVLSGAAGLKLGWSLVAPGRFSRLESLKSSAQSALKMVYGAAGMLVIAAFIEAFWSANGSTSNLVKYFAASLLWVFVIIYFLFVGREKRQTDGFR